MKSAAARPPESASPPTPNFPDNQVDPNGLNPPRSSVSSPVLAEAERWALSLTEAQLEGIRRYQSQAAPNNAGYNDVNRFLRDSRSPTGHAQAWVDQIIESLNLALDKGRAFIDITVYRAIRAKHSLLKAWALAKKTGLPWTDCGFISTTTDQTALPQFHGSTSLAKVIMEFVILSGTAAVFPSASTGRLSAQAKILLGRDARFEIISIERSDDVFTVKVRLLS